MLNNAQYLGPKSGASLTILKIIFLAASGEFISYMKVTIFNPFTPFRVHAKWLLNIVERRRKRLRK